jgi:phosphoribulokinase
MLAVGGDSGTGKTTLTRGIYDIFGAENIVNICLDDYHTLDRVGRRAAGITALNPAANNMTLMEEQVEALRDGKGILKPVYNHSTGTFDPPEWIEPRPIVIIRGLFPLYTERLRSLFDVRVWLDPNEELKYHWKVKRDVAQRGYVLEQVIKEIVERQDDVRAHIHPQKAHADVVVRFCPPPGYLKARAQNRPDDSHLNVEIIRRRIRTRLDLSDVIEQPNGGEKHSLREREGEHEGEPAVILEIDGDITSGKAAELEEKIWDHMSSHRHLRPEEFGTYLEEGKTPRHSDSLALTQLVIAYRILVEREWAASESGGGFPALARAV